MKGLVSKEHYRYKVLILLMKSSAYFNQKTLSPPPPPLPAMIFQKY